MTVGFLLTNDRAARMVAQSAVDPVLPGLDDVIDRLVDATFGVPASIVYEAEIKRAIQRVVVDRLIDVAETAPMAQVRAIATHHLEGAATPCLARPHRPRRSPTPPIGADRERHPESSWIARRTAARVTSRRPARRRERRLAIFRAWTDC